MQYGFLEAAELCKLTFSQIRDTGGIQTGHWSEIRLLWNWRWWLALKLEMVKLL